MPNAKTKKTGQSAAKKTGSGGSKKSADEPSSWEQPILSEKLVENALREAIRHARSKAGLLNIWAVFDYLGLRVRFFDQNGKRVSEVVVDFGLDRPDAFVSMMRDPDGAAGRSPEEQALRKMWLAAEAALEKEGYEFHGHAKTAGLGFDGDMLILQSDGSSIEDPEHPKYCGCCSKKMPLAGTIPECPEMRESRLCRTCDEMVCYDCCNRCASCTKIKCDGCARRRRRCGHCFVGFEVEDK